VKHFSIEIKHRFSEDLCFIFLYFFSPIYRTCAKNWTDGRRGWGGLLLNQLEAQVELKCLIIWTKINFLENIKDAPSACRLRHITVSGKRCSVSDQAQ